jgi:nitrile hydratase subunit alpha
MSGTHHDLEEHGHEGVKPSAEAGRYASRIRAIEALLVEKGVLTEEDVRRQIEHMEARSPTNGARLVARAWVDPGFKALLLSDTKAAALTLGIDASGPVEFVTVENTPEVHNLIACTLCSCYPRAILGRPPDWYKSFNYRSRAVNEPRTVMREFGLEIPEDTKVAVHDSSADVRYLVLPMRPPGTEDMNEEELADLVTRDCLIGVSVPSVESARAGASGTAARRTRRDAE